MCCSRTSSSAFPLPPISPAPPSVASSPSTPSSAATAPSTRRLSSACSTIPSSPPSRRTPPPWPPAPSSVSTSPAHPSSPPPPNIPGVQLISLTDASSSPAPRSKKEAEASSSPITANFGSGTSLCATPCTAAARCIVLPAVPGDLKALVPQLDLLSLESFLAPGEDEEDPLSFRVMCLAQCRMNLLLLVFSSLDGQWSAPDTFASFENNEPRLSDRQFAHGCFLWRLRFQNKLLGLDVRAMELSAVDLPEQGWTSQFVIVETTEGTLAMLTKSFDEDSEDGRYWLTYSILTNNQWHLEKVIPLPVKHVNLVGVAGGYLLIDAMYTTSSQEKLKFGYLSVDVKTLQVELFAAPSEHLPGRLYAGFPPSLCAPTI